MKMNRAIFNLFLLSLCLIFLVSCASSTSNVGIGEFVSSPDGNYSFINNVVINNQELSRHIQVVDIKGRINNNVMEAMVQVINKYDRDYNFEYRFNWYDNKGFEIRSIKEHWTPVLISGQETMTLTGVAPDPNAVKFRINIRASHSIR